MPPVRDEESETQRKAHAKRVRETRRSTQGVTLDEIKSAEQLVKKKQQQNNESPPATALSTQVEFPHLHLTNNCFEKPSYQKRLTETIVDSSEDEFHDALTSLDVNEAQLSGFRKLVVKHYTQNARKVELCSNPSELVKEQNNKSNVPPESNLSDTYYNDDTGTEKGPSQIKIGDPILGNSKPCVIVNKLIGLLVALAIPHLVFRTN